MQKNQLTQWCDKATCQIRFGPDRKKVADELMGHLEDRKDALMAQGMDEKDATEKVLEAMGDAKEIAPQLGALHRPFWGYFECVTRYIACVMCIVLVFVSGFLLNTWGLDPLFDEKNDKYHHFNEYNANTQLECIIDFNPNMTGGFDGYTFTADRLAMWQWIEPSDTSGILCLKLDIRDNTLLTESRPFLQYLWVEDSLGNQYYDLYLLPENAKRLAGYTVENSMFSTSYDLFIMNFPAQDVSWIKVCYDRDGRQMELHIDLTGGDGP